MATSLRCLREDFQNDRSKDDGFTTQSFLEQMKVESSVGTLYSWFRHAVDLDPTSPELMRKKHVHFLLKGLKELPESYECLDASRPWLCYWIVHSLEVLDEPISDVLKSQVARFLGKCQCPDGGFAGGPNQLAHLAPTYAAVNALCILGTPEAYSIINRETLQSYLKRMKTPEGSFMMHVNGEADVRGAYCALAVARLTNIATDELFEDTAEWIVGCQTYEGGFAGVPSMEAHGGYSFCGYASLVLLGKEKLCDTEALLYWTVNRQMKLEGGFQGRTNKLVDGCYSFWLGAILPLIHRTLFMEGDECLSQDKWMFHQGGLQEYLLICCQHPTGGLIDKPAKSRDFYHTCYCLSGLSVAQHFGGHGYDHKQITGDRKNELLPVHPVYNIGMDAVGKAMDHFGKLPVP